MVNIKKLSNGITVVLEEMSYLRSTAFGVWVKVGSANEDKSNNGISHMIEHMLFKGTKSRTAKQIADDMARIGGNINAFTSKECTSYYATTLDSHLPIAIDIISDMLLNSTISEKELTKEKGVIIEEIDMYDDSPEDLAHEMLQKNVWREHPLGYLISGDKETVRSITREQILDFIDKYYVASNIVISIAGNYNEEEVLQLLENSFGSIPVGEPSKRVSIPVYNRSLYSKNKDIEQIHLNIAYDSIDYNSEDKYALAIVNSILGGSINSRLFQNIRENHGLTYSIYSYGSSYKDAGLFHIYAAMNPTQTEVVFDKIFEVIEEMKREGVTEEELAQTKEQIKTELIISSESTKSRMNGNGKSMMNRGRVILLDETIERVNAVTRDDIIRYLNQYYNSNMCSISLVGNLDEINLERIKEKWNNLSE
ncbi:M16 family metallopeptidase [Anaeromicropila herbilytica]|uniref:Peptidase M16 n=1 Tax=Anaeromicropila herbilytica TaxID=2785025 RepID=A0A7R7EMQ1_9FIRM|nr:pitrilysin family protein [Anaeromicropila herbilytica]BCN31456.1 peptidase M16 [Anaeromicropila herbilytica]